MHFRESQNRTIFRCNSISGTFLGQQALTGTLYPTLLGFNFHYPYPTWNFFPPNFRVQVSNNTRRFQSRILSMMPASQQRRERNSLFFFENVWPCGGDCTLEESDAEKMQNFALKRDFSLCENNEHVGRKGRDGVSKFEYFSKLTMVLVYQRPLQDLLTSQNPKNTFKWNFRQFEALWPSAYMPCHDHCQSCQWCETEIVSQLQIKYQSRLEFGEILRKIQLKIQA